ncbi:MAG: M23 family metallopeptidase [Halobacteriovoraceae bacterium]|nr:M23 family metallopeptidase [Halobacteriovoraceae bacterium]
MKNQTLNKASVFLAFLTLSLASQAQHSRLDNECLLEVKDKKEVTVKDIVEDDSQIIHPLVRAPHEKKGFGTPVRNTGAYLNARGGTDLFTTPGIGVRSMANAEVKHVGHWYMGSHSITAELENGKVIRYGFLRNVAVRPGDTIKKNQLIGTVSPNTYGRFNDVGRLRIEIFDRSSTSGLTVRKPCLNRRDDVVNPDSLLKTLEENTFKIR